MFEGCNFSGFMVNLAIKFSYAMTYKWLVSIGEQVTRVNDYVYCLTLASNDDKFNFTSCSL